MRSLQISALYFLCLAALTGCNDKQPFLASDLARASDGVVVKCEPFAGQDHRCLVFSQPWSRQLRVWDLTDNAIVPSPVGLFPLAIKVGPSTGLMRNHPELDYSYALDTVEGRLYVISNKFMGDKASFSTPRVIDLAHKNISDFSFISGANGQKIIAYSVPSKQLISYVVIDPGTGLQDTTVNIPDFEPGKLALPLVFRPQMMAVGADKNTLILSSVDAALNQVAVLAQGAMTLIPIGGPTLKIAAGRMNVGQGLENIAIALRTDIYEAVVISLDSTPQAVIGRFSFDTLPVQIYIPEQPVASCCGGVTSWAIVVDAYSKLHYLDLRNVRVNSNTKTTVDLADNRSLGARATLASAIVPGMLDNGRRESYIIFGADYGLVAKFNEGSDEFRPLSSID